MLTPTIAKLISAHRRDDGKYVHFAASVVAFHARTLHMVARDPQDSVLFVGDDGFIAVIMPVRV